MTKFGGRNEDARGVTGAEIYSQPEVLERLLQTEAGTVRAVGSAVRNFAPRFAMVVARGSSDNAGLYAKYLLGAANRIPVGLAAPSLFTVYGSPPDLSRALLIAISQSGQSPDLLEVAENGRRQGAMTVAITNDASSPLAGLCESVIPIHAGEERGVAATKSYSGQLLAIAMLSVAIAGDDQVLSVLATLPSLVQASLSSEERVKVVAERLKESTRCVVIGRGFDYATAQEIALKLKELSGVAAGPYSPADFMHGPVAMVGEDFPALLIAPRSRVFEEMRGLAGRLAGLGVEVAVISDDEGLLGSVQHGIPLGCSAPDWLLPFVTVVPGQLLALHLTLARGLNPDHPARLRKVTKTL